MSYTIEPKTTGQLNERQARLYVYATQCALYAQPEYYYSERSYTIADRALSIRGHIKHWRRRFGRIKDAAVWAFKEEW